MTLWFELINASKCVAAKSGVPAKIIFKGFVVDIMSDNIHNQNIIDSILQIVLRIFNHKSIPLIDITFVLYKKYYVGYSGKLR